MQTRRDWLRWVTATLVCGPGGCGGGPPVDQPVSPPAAGPRRLPPPLAADPAGLLEVPAGFRYAVLQSAERHRLDDGRNVPGRFDGMACFDLPDGSWVLLRNHELGGPGWAAQRGLTGSSTLVAWTAADKPEGEAFGGVSRLVLDPDGVRRLLAGETGAKAVRSTRMVLTGTDRNCAGGPLLLPGARGWVSCEESDEPGHGFAYFVPAEAVGVGSGKRLAGWGCFRHEGVARGDDGTIYLTEDLPDGLLYRFRPNDPGAPLSSGTLEALVLDGLVEAHPERGPGLTKGARKVGRWAAVPDPSARERPCRQQLPAATRFRRCEGMVWAGGAVWFSATQAGENRRGQILKLTPSRGGDIVEVVAAADGAHLSGPDNLALAPWGDVIVCEDNYSSDDVVRSQYVRGLQPDGTPYDLARNPRNEPDGPGGSPGAEFAGACFSPDGRVLFVNLNGADVTFAITGPWPV